MNAPFLFIALALCAVGIAALYSAGNGFHPWASKQLLGIFMFLPLVFIIALLDIKSIYDNAYNCYLICLIILIITYIAGYQAMGAKRWVSLGGFFTIQPSEIMKVAVVICVARLYADLHSKEVNSFKVLCALFGYLAPPVILILLQPNLSTAVIIVLTSVVISFIAGTSYKRYFTSGAVLLVLAPIIWFKMHAYQKRRVLNFMNPEADPLGSGYNLIQSKIAIGSGGLWGKGFLSGTQHSLNFLPEKQTDFILTLLAEEFGFVGIILIILLFMLFFLAGLKVALEARSHFARLLVIGLLFTIFTHFSMNIAMISGLIPIVGTPMPFLSYGRSNLLFCLMAVGLILNAGVYRNKRVGNF